MRTPLVIACCLALTACSAAPQPNAEPSKAAPSPSTAAPSPSTAAPSPSTVAPSPSTVAPSKEAEPSYSTNLKDCADGTCEVLLTSSGGLTPAKKFGIGRITLTHIPPNRLNFTVVRANDSTVTGYVGGDGYLSLSAGPTITIERHNEDGALLRFEPKGRDRKNDTASGSDGVSLYSNS